MNDLEYILRDRAVYCMVREAGDYTENGGTSRIYVSRDMEAARYPKSLASLEGSENVVILALVNEEKEGTGDSSIGSRVLVFLVLLGSCVAYFCCFYLLEWP